MTSFGRNCGGGCAEWTAVPTVGEHYDARYPLAGELMQAKIVLAPRISPGVIATPYKR
jgi:hypothetical protein